MVRGGGFGSHSLFIMITACVIFYNDGPDLLERCLKSLKGKVDRIVCVDGPFKEFPHKKHFSTDGCVDIALLYGDHLIDGRVWEDQPLKRNAYLLGGTDYYLVIDSDEEWIGGLHDYHHQDIYSVPIIVDHKTYLLESNSPRIFKHAPGIYYTKRHSQIILGDKFISPANSAAFPRFKYGKLIHRPHHRTEQRIIDKGEYYRTRAENKENIIHECV